MRDVLVEHDDVAVLDRLHVGEAGASTDRLGVLPAALAVRQEDDVGVRVDDRFSRELRVTGPVTLGAVGDVRANPGVGREERASPADL